MRAAIRSELESINPLDALELRHRSEALAWVDSGAPLFRTAKPATPPRHLVSYFAVVDDESILLVDHKNAQLWLPPGGHVEEGEHPRDTVAREIREELGFAPTHEIAPPLMVTCTTTVGLSSGHTDVSLWYVVNAARKCVLRGAHGVSRSFRGSRENNGLDCQNSRAGRQSVAGLDRA